MSSKIAKVTVLIIAVALILVEVAPRWQLRAANDEDLTTTEISVDNGTGDDPDNAPEQEKPAVTPKPAQTAAPAKRESAKPKADDSGKGKAADAGKSQVAKNRKHAAKHKNKKHHPAAPTPVPTYRPIEGNVQMYNIQYLSQIQKLKDANKRITDKRQELITKTQSLTVRQAYLEKMRRTIGSNTMAVKVAATGSAVSKVVSAATVQGLDSTVDQVVYQGYILCNPDYFDVLTVSGMDTFFEENETFDLGLYLDKEINQCGRKLRNLKKPVHHIRSKYEKIHTRYVKGIRKHNPVIFNPYDLTVRSGVTKSQMRKMLEGSELVTLAPVFVKAEHKYGVNAVGLASIAALESARGTSRRARQDHNFTGFGVDSDDAQGINAASDQANIMRTAKWLAKSYLTQDGIYYDGTGLMEINHHYSASFTWAWKVEHCVKQMFENLQ